MRGPAEAISAAVYTAAITVDRVVEPDVRTVVVGDDVARRCLFEDFEFRFWWFPDPFN
jgi:hypothetical protein